MHFAEIFFQEPGTRRFAVLLEGKKVLTDFDPGKVNFATADRQAFEVDVSDGALDIRFEPIAIDPKVSAIEIDDLK